MKSKKHLIIIVAITMIAAVVSVQLCGCLSIAEFKKLFEDSGPRGLYSAGVAQDYFKLHTEALDVAADWFKANPNVVYVVKGADSSYNNRTKSVNSEFFHPKNYRRTRSTESKLLYSLFSMIRLCSP